MRKGRYAAIGGDFGPAEIDKAILDALLRGAGMDFFDGMRANMAGIDARLSPDLSHEDITRFLTQGRRRNRVAMRHTVGLDDSIEGALGIADGHENSAARYFKLKLLRSRERYRAADPHRPRTGEAAAHPYSVTLDANEQYADFGCCGSGRSPHAGLSARPDRSRLLYIEQPLPRDITWDVPLGAIAVFDFIIDEADDSYDAFQRARARLSRHFVQGL